jgi:hypothetical protein
MQVDARKYLYRLSKSQISHDAPRGSHDGNNSGFYIGMVLRALNLHKLLLSGAAE